MNFRKKKLISIVALVGFILLLLFLFIRNSLLAYLVNRKISAFQEKHKVQVEVKVCDFKGVTGILINGITVAPSASDTLLSVDSIFFNIRLFPLLTGKIRFSNLEISNSSIHLIQNKQRNNFSFLSGKGKANKDSILPQTDYSKLAERVLNTLFDAIPATVNFKNTKIKIEKDSLNLGIAIPQLAINNHEFNTQVSFFENNETRVWVAKGTIFSDDRKAELKIFPLGKSTTEFPVLKQKWKLTLAFDTLLMNVSDVNYENEELHLHGRITAQNFKINHWRISPNNVTIATQTADCFIRVGANFLAIDSASTINYNKVSFHPFLKFQLYPYRQLQLDVNLPESNSESFFESFPQGLFENIDGIKTSGTIYYRLHFLLDTRHPDDLQFSSYLGKKNFKIKGFGKSVLTKINGEFQYTAFEKGRAVRTFMVGPSNPFYTPLDQISSLLKAALLTSEDGNFYSHAGFNEDAFRKSIATNFKEKRFVRGGSTISMQLIKNVFLTRNKTVARKIEEALLVWLIENNRLSSKDRMYEVYLNLIEWGPNVYGIGEASKFYFDKSPANLTLAESIYLAMIVPRPKGFKYNFDATGKLRESAAGYYSLVAGHMVKKGVLSEAEMNSLLPSVELKGASKNMILVTDSTEIPIDMEEDLNLDN